MGAIILESSNGDSAGRDYNHPNSKLIAFEILSAILQLLSILFNGAIICTLSRRSLLKYPSNRFVFSLCASHLSVSFLSVTISFISIFIPASPSSFLYSGFTSSHQNAFNKGLELPLQANGPVTAHCSSSGVDLAHLIMMHLNFGVAVCTSITVALISVERYITIARPMRYKSIVTARRTLYAIICCWLLTALITIMPLLLFENRDSCGAFSVPMGSLATYFGIVFAVVTLFALAVMIVCYTHIFRIAKAKCQKVQIGHFTASTVSSISSDWPSSVYSSAQGQHRFLHAGSRIESSNSLLHWVLMTNLGRHAQPLRVPSALRGGVPLTPPATPTLPPKNAFFSESALNTRRESDETTTTGASSSRNGSTSSSNSGVGHNNVNSPSNYFIDPSRSPLFQYHQFTHPRKLRNRWKTYLQPNYNSPRKTIFTIVLLIGSVLFTQLPLSFVLFTSTLEATQRWFQFCTTVLFSTSSVANPVLYGFLNRSIRDQLWRILKRKSRHGGEHGPSASSFRKRKRGQQQQLDEIAQNSKGFLSPANHRHLQDLCRNGNATGGVREIPAIKISRKESISSDDNSSVHSVTSTNSVNTIGTNNTTTSNKAKINQVQKRLTVTPSPYYRSVLLKKASFNLSKSNSLLPRLVLPDVNVRRNSSGSIINIRNGVMSKTKGKVKEGNETRSSKEDVENRNGQHITSGENGELVVEMQTFRNYSTPDLPLSLDSPSHIGSDEIVKSSNENNTDNDKDKEGVERNSENKSQVQVQITTFAFDDETSESTNSSTEANDNCQDSNLCNDILIESIVTVPEPIIPDVDSNELNMQAGPSHINENDATRPDDGNVRSDKKLEGSFSVESLIGVVVDDELLPDNFPRKPSQDSGADMSFSDEEDETPIISSPTILHHAASTPVLLSASSISQLPPGTVAVILRTPGRDPGVGNNGNLEQQRPSLANSSPSLMGPFLLVEHAENSRNSRNSRGLPDAVLLPSSCSNGDSHSINSSDEDEEPDKKGHAGVTVTITDSNSDTQLYNPNLLNNHHNNRLLRVDRNLCCHKHTLQHHPHCLVGRAMVMEHHKSKSDSDIFTANQTHHHNHNHNQNSNLDLRVRSNCHINYLAVNSSSKSSLSSDNQLNINNDAFTLICCDCDDCPSCKRRAEVSNPSNKLSSNSNSCCSLWVTSGTIEDSLSNAQLPLNSGSYCSLDQSHNQKQYVLKSSGSNLNLFGSATQSPQWLSVMSVHSSCSSLSSTCPLRILDEQNKSDISDYDDFEDPIEI